MHWEYDDLSIYCEIKKNEILLKIRDTYNLSELGVKK